jgi:hypothetical protein
MFSITLDGKNGKNNFKNAKKCILFGISYASPLRGQLLAVRLMALPVPGVQLPVVICGYFE